MNNLTDKEITKLNIKHELARQEEKRILTLKKWEWFELKQRGKTNLSFEEYLLTDKK